MAKAVTWGFANALRAFTDLLATSVGLAVEVPIIASGRIDAIATWYDLWLDDEGGFSTSPLSARDAMLKPGLRLTSCWEQAVFIPDVAIPVEAGQTVRVTVECEEEKRLRWRLGLIEHGASVAELSVGTCGEFTAAHECGAGGATGGVSTGGWPAQPLWREAKEAARPEHAAGRVVAPTQDDAVMMAVETLDERDGRTAGSCGVQAIPVVEVGERCISVLNDGARNLAYFGTSRTLCCLRG